MYSLTVNTLWTSELKLPQTLHEQCLSPVRILFCLMRLEFRVNLFSCPSHLYLLSLEAFLWCLSVHPSGSRVSPHSGPSPLAGPGNFSWDSISTVRSCFWINSPFLFLSPSSGHRSQRLKLESVMKGTITGHLGLGLLSVKGRDRRPGQEGTLSKGDELALSVYSVVRALGHSPKDPGFTSWKSAPIIPIPRKCSYKPRLTFKNPVT